MGKKTETEDRSNQINRFVLELKGCVKRSKIKPLEVKKIWEKAYFYRFYSI